MKVRSISESLERYVRNSMRAYLDGEQGLPWICGVVLHSGMPLPAATLVLMGFRGYGLADRFQTLAAWFERTSTENAQAAAVE